MNRLLIMIRVSKYILPVVFLSLALLPLNVRAAAITMNDLPYFCDFEDDAEIQNWVLNPGVEAVNTDNRWTVGNATAYTGNRSLYVSADNGTNNSYKSTNNMLVAYRDVTLDAGTYDIAYDFYGAGAAGDGYLKVFYGNLPTSNIKCVGNNQEPEWVSSKSNQFLMGTDVMLTGADSWHHVQTTLTISPGHANKTTTRLFFVWVNSNATKNKLESVAIDNLQLAKTPPTYPDNPHVGSYLGVPSFLWDDNADSYEIMYRKKTEDSFMSAQSFSASLEMAGKDFGAYEVWIRAHRGTDASIFYVYRTLYLYQTDCFDALNMYGATFEYGKWNKTTGLAPTGYTRVDYGPESKDSRHTTHFDLDEIDPRTIYRKDKVTYGLHTVPNGEYGSIRLGNWSTNSEYESMTFKYTVDSKANAVLIIHYAIVLENPDHPADEQPRFTLDVFDEAGEPIDTKCASVDFHSPTSSEWNMPEIRELWHDVGSVKWQDWKTIGLSVEDYVGQTLTIKLTSYDCDQSGHFGYAYFMLNCSRSDVDGLPWGDNSETQMFTAPEGFNYEWYDRRDTEFKNVLSTERFFHVAENDTNTYVCHVTYPSNPECGFWFDASAKPHHPKAELGWKWDPKNCQNGYRYYNRCHVMLTNQVDGKVEHRYDKQIENCTLLLPDGSQVPFAYPDEGIYVPSPDEGETVTYGIATGIYVNSTLFADTAWLTINVPPIGPLETHQYEEICEGEYIVFPEDSGIKREEEKIYENPLKSLVTGCDSTVYMHLTVHPLPMVDIFDTICNGQSYWFDGKQYTSAPAIPPKALLTSKITGCDSLVTLHLTEAIQPIIELVSPQVCPDDGLLLAINNAEFCDELHILIPNVLDTTILGGLASDTLVVMSEAFRAGDYQLYAYVHERWCDGLDSIEVPFSMSLSSSVVEAKFNDVLTFLDYDYNGGYRFLAYQWYADGEAIEGATEGYYFQPDLDYDVEFTVQVTLEDGTQVWTCPFTFRNRVPTDIEDLQQGERDNYHPYKIIRDGHLIIIHNQNEYNALGIKIR